MHKNRTSTATTVFSFFLLLLLSVANANVSKTTGHIKTEKCVNLNGNGKVIKPISFSITIKFCMNGTDLNQPHEGNHFFISKHKMCTEHYCSEWLLFMGKARTKIPFFFLLFYRKFVYLSIFFLFFSLSFAAIKNVFILFTASIVTFKKKRQTQSKSEIVKPFPAKSGGRRFYRSSFYMFAVVNCYGVVVEYSERMSVFHINFPMYFMMNAK